MLSLAIIENKSEQMFLPIAHNGVRWGLVPVSTTLLLTATAEKEKINQKCFLLGIVTTGSGITTAPLQLQEIKTKATEW